MKTVPCPECGTEIPPESELCDSCYAESLDPVSLPDSLELEVCTRCGSYDLGEGWTSEDEAVPEAELVLTALEGVLQAHVDARRPSVSVAARKLDRDSYEVDVDFTAEVRGEPVEETVTVPVSISRTTCTTCSRRSGGYYESIVQVRAEGRQPSEEEVGRAEEVAYEIAGKDYGDRETFVTKTEEVQGGVDIYMSTSKAGRQVADRLAEEYGGSVGESATLVGEREGDEVYRVTYAVELPEFVAGDVVEIDDDVALVENNRRGLRATSLETGESRSYPEDVEATKLGEARDAAETTVVSHRDDEIQVLDPETYDTVTLERPSFVPPSAEQTPAISTESGLYLLPWRESTEPKDA